MPPAPRGPPAHPARWRPGLTGEADDGGDPVDGGGEAAVRVPHLHLHADRDAVPAVGHRTLSPRQEHTHTSQRTAETGSGYYDNATVENDTPSLTFLLLANQSSGYCKIQKKKIMSAKLENRSILTKRLHTTARDTKWWK